VFDGVAVGFVGEGVGDAVRVGVGSAVGVGCRVGGALVGVLRGRGRVGRGLSVVARTGAFVPGSVAVGPTAVGGGSSVPVAATPLRANAASPPNRAAPTPIPVNS